jgi:hypothetical protein
LHVIHMVITHSLKITLCLHGRSELGYQNQVNWDLDMKNCNEICKHCLRHRSTTSKHRQKLLQSGGAHARAQRPYFYLSFRQYRAPHDPQHLALGRALAFIYSLHPFHKTCCPHHKHILYTSKGLLLNVDCCKIVVLAIPNTW